MDVRIVNDGSVIGFTPLTPAAQEFFDERIETESWQWMGPTLWVDHRTVEALVDGMLSEGLEVGS